MAIETKEIQDFVEDKLGLLKTDWGKARQEDKEAFENSVVKAVKDMQTEIQKEYQKEMDEAIVALKEDMKSQAPKKVLNFDQAFKKSIVEQEDEFREMFKAASKGVKGTMDLKAFDYSSFTGYEDFATEFQPNLVPLLYEPFHYRNVLPVGRMSGEFVQFPKETATGATGGAAVWQPGSGSKPDISPKVIKYTAEAEWIAGLIKQIPIGMLEDLSFMQSFLANKGRNELMLAEDNAIQNGADAILGLLQESVTYAGSKTVFVEKLIDVAFNVMPTESKLRANGIVMSHADYTDIMLQKAGGSQEYDLPKVVGLNPDGTMTIAGIPMFPNSYLDAGQAIIGDWNQAQLLIRSNPRLRFFEQNNDDAEKNQLLMRIEERIALAVYRQNGFYKLASIT